MKNSEEWRPVVGYEGKYSVSNLGRVRSEKRKLIDGRNWPEKILTPLKSNGDMVHSLRDGKKHKLWRAKRLVMLAFGDRKSLPPRCCVIHSDQDIRNNSFTNLKIIGLKSLLHRDRRDEVFPLDKQEKYWKVRVVIDKKRFQYLGPYDSREYAEKMLDLFRKDLIPRRIKTTKSGYKGVYQQYGGKWETNICVNRVSRRLGLFDTAKEAARAYNNACPEGRTKNIID